eukprot:764054-Hanusia_phi.AAC.4
MEAVLKVSSTGCAEYTTISSREQTSSRKDFTNHPTVNQEWQRQNREPESRLQSKRGAGVYNTKRIRTRPQGPVMTSPSSSWSARKDLKNDAMASALLL